MDLILPLYSVFTNSLFLHELKWTKVMLGENYGKIHRLFKVSEKYNISVFYKRKWWSTIHNQSLFLCTANRLIAYWGRMSDQGQTCSENCCRQQTTQVTSEAARYVIYYCNLIFYFNKMCFSWQISHPYKMLTE